MIKYLLKRIGTAIVTLFIAATLTFFIMNLVPGDPFLSDKAPTEEARAALRAKYGLDRPLVVQYTNYMKNLLHGDFGVSYVQAKNKPIRDIIAQSFPISARVGSMAILVAFFLGVPLGCISAHTVDAGVRCQAALVPDLGHQKAERLCASCDCSFPFSHELYRAFNAIKHAGCTGAGLYPDRACQGHEYLCYDIQACTPQLHTARHYLHGSYDREYTDRRICGREDFQHTGHGQLFCKVHPEP